MIACSLISVLRRILNEILPGMMSVGDTVSRHYGFSVGRVVLSMLVSRVSVVNWYHVHCRHVKDLSLVGYIVKTGHLPTRTDCCAW